MLLSIIKLLSTQLPASTGVISREYSQGGFPIAGEANSIAFPLYIRITGARQLKFAHRQHLPRPQALLAHFHTAPRAVTFRICTLYAVVCEPLHTAPMTQSLYEHFLDYYLIRRQGAPGPKTKRRGILYRFRVDNKWIEHIPISRSSLAIFRNSRDTAAAM
jgi:hypothetical protein